MLGKPLLGSTLASISSHNHGGQSSFEWWAQIGLPILGLAVSVLVGVATVFVGYVAWRTSRSAVAIAEKAEKAARRARIDTQMPNWRVSTWGVGVQDGGMRSSVAHFNPPLLEWSEGAQESIDEDTFASSYSLPEERRREIAVTTRVRIRNYGPGGALVEGLLPRSLRPDIVHRFDLGEGKKREFLLERIETVEEWARLHGAEETATLIATFSVESDGSSGARDTYEVWMSGSAMLPSGDTSWAVNLDGKLDVLRGVTLSVHRQPREYFGIS